MSYLAINHDSEILYIDAIRLYETAHSRPMTEPGVTLNTTANGDGDVSEMETIDDGEVLVVYREEMDVLKQRVRKMIDIIDDLLMLLLRLEAARNVDATSSDVIVSS